MKVLLALALLLVPALASAQTSPCDKPPISGTVTIFTPTFPFAMKIPAGLTPTLFKITVDGTKSDLPTTAAPPNTAGDSCFLVSVTVAVGNHNIDTSYTPSGGVEVSSTNPFVLKFVDPRPVNHPR
jgi:hypothetical protein